MGINQDIGGYSLSIGNNEGFSIYRMTDAYSAPGTLSFYYNAASGAVMEGSRLEVWLDDELDHSYDLSSCYDPETTQYYLDYVKELAAAKQLTIKLYNIKASSLVFREFNLKQKGAGVIVNERFNGELEDWWDANEFGNDFSTVAGALYYSLFYDGGTTYEYELMKAFTAVDISEGMVFLNTDQSDLQIRATTGEWINLVNFPTDAAADPYLYMDNPPEGFGGRINAIRKHFVFTPY